MKFQSFTGTLRGFMQGDVSSDSLTNANGVEFGCARVHLFPTKKMQDKLGKTYPSEVLAHAADDFDSEMIALKRSMNQGERLQRHLLRIGRHDCSQTPVEMVSETVREKYEQFISIIEQLDKKGLVSFRKKMEPVDYALSEHLLFQSFNDLYGSGGKVEQLKKKFAEKNS